MNGMPGNRTTPRDWIEAVLRMRLNRSRKQYLEAARRFQQIAMQIPDRSHLGSDGVRRLLNAATERGMAFAKYEVELKVFTDFVLEGKIPTDLESGQ